MRIPNLGEVELLVPLQEGIFEQPMWSTFLSRLKRVAGVHAAHIRLRLPGARDETDLSAGADQFPRAPSDAELREGRVYSAEELGSGRDADMDMRVMRLAGSEEIEAWIALRGEDLDAEHSRLLTALAPYFRVALRVLASLEREKARASFSADALARMNFGWIALDERCRVVESDPQAERFLARSRVLRRGPYDRLTPSLPEIDRQLTALVRDCAADPNMRPRAINMCRDPWIEVLVSPVHLDTLVGDSRTVAMLYLRGDRSSSADRHEQLVDLFDLTPAEARLAWSLSQGLSIAEAAEQHGLTVETARYYSKKIYAKTGARGQVDLVRNILTGVLALA
ncbi:helix-turn-helix transcriptional regulator [Qipengyuania sp. XHP0207]|uniref:helix-turn-helix transcriptional regulator n=1 Tax=Qipengyuania sp. XHP0207 TaxID=3038078 RepID=UPI00241ECDA2|nr:helix-turn-helix transcriptional regulator [Qipengyuania sp. XHP0207]MDG5747618.1 helix-turn-helix transcriptional regulator [Qipengyuania sp. XHP0207]